MDVAILSRIQFAFTVTFHYIYPPMSIGLSLALIVMEGIYLKTKDLVWQQMTQFWLKLFSMTFVLGVATGIPMMFTLGTNWSRYSRFVSDVAGTIIGAEGMFAFLIEAGFLGLLLFGWHRVSSKIHFLSTILVSLGAHLSAIWIISFNSWMHSPTGYRLATLPDGTEVAQLADWWAVFFSPLNMSHIVHVLLGAWMCGSFLIVSVSAYYLLKKKHLSFAQKSISLSLLMGCITSLLQLFSADYLARKVARYNPEKFAAFEAVYKTAPETPAYLCGWVDESKEKVYGISIPGLLSLMVHRDINTPVIGMDQIAKEDRPWVAGVFQLYHLMVFMWAAMFLTIAIGLFYLFRKKLASIPSIYLKLMIVSVLFPQIANIAGWYSACMGRQPWIVYKLLRTKDSFSPIVSSKEVVASLTMFFVLYLSLFFLFLLLFDKKIKKGPDSELADEEENG